MYFFWTIVDSFRGGLGRAMAGLGSPVQISL